MTDKRKKFERLLLSSVSNLAMSFADSYIEKNVERRASAGLKATVIRRQLGECCEWCRNLAGIYTADKLPADIYKRHANCRCMVTYKTEKVYTDAWSKKQFATEKEARLEREKEIKAEAAKRESEQKELRLEMDRKVRASRSKESIERQRQEMLEKEKKLREKNTIDMLLMKASYQDGDKAESFTSRGIELPDYIKSYLDNLKEENQYIKGAAGSFTHEDIRILSIEEDVEFAIFTIKEESYLIRGNKKGVSIPEEISKEIISNKGTIDAHSHPYMRDIVPSPDDLNVLDTLYWQETSDIISESGMIGTYNKFGITRVKR